MATSTLSYTFIPELENRRQGKVRDIYDGGETLTLIASDRISVFDVILNDTIPDKGRLLTELSLFWFEKTKDIIQNHIISHPDPNVMIVKKCQTLPIEIIVRQYISGSMWRDYKSGKRTKCGITIPEGLKENDRLHHAIVTPTTKNDHGHDEDISKEELIKNGTVTEKLWNELESTALKLFERGTELLKEKGLILVDTKYEFGMDSQGKLTLIDEIHTPDSSRFWFQKDVDKKELKFPDKEMAREYCRQQGFVGEGTIPKLPTEVIQKVRSGYCSVYETITGKKLEETSINVSSRVLKHLREANIIKGCFALIIAGSEQDQPHIDKITAGLDAHLIPHKTIIASAHKVPKKVIEIIDTYNQSLEPLVCITVAGRSNALSGMVSGSLKWPVIACPPFKDHSDYLANIHSSIQMPSKVDAMTVIDPGNAASATAKILRTMELKS
jgi:fusion protein PurCD